MVAAALSTTCAAAGTGRGVGANVGEGDTAAHTEARHAVPAVQSESFPHVPPSPHGVHHVPPQSTSVSPPFCWPSTHDTDVGNTVGEAEGGGGIGDGGASANVVAANTGWDVGDGDGGSEGSFSVGLRVG
jgi:hypothetical protein